MELKRRIDFRKYITVFYAAALLMYLILGMQPAEARNYEVSGQISIPSIGLTSDVTTLELVDHKLDTPDTIVGSYSRNSSKVFLIGHSSTVFVNLKNAEIGDAIYYNNSQYVIADMETLPKSEIKMNELLAPSAQETMIIMTCAGEPVGEKDATHRLIVTALKQ